MRLAVSSIALTAFALAGCATIIHGTSDRVTVTSGERDAQIYVNNVLIGKGSGITSLDRGDIHTIRVEKEGCEPVTVQTDDSFDPTTLLGILIDGGIISIPIDLITGAAWKADQKVYTATPVCPENPRVARRPQRSGGDDGFGGSRGDGGAFGSGGDAFTASASAGEAAIYLGFASSEEWAQNTAEFLWIAEATLLDGVRPVIQQRLDPATGQPRFHIYGAGLSGADAADICDGLEAGGNLCRVVEARS